MGRSHAGRSLSVLRAAPAFGLVLLLVAALVMLADAARPLPAQADSSGPNYPDTGDYDAGPGTIIWAFPGYITADDTSYATATLGVNAISYYIRGTDYDFALPSDATVGGIEVKVGRFASGNDIRDYEVRLIKGGSIAGDNKAATGTTWPTGGVEEATYGGSSDLWGTTWAYSDLNASNFGVALAAKNFAATLPMAEVDYMNITVTYTVPAAPVITEAATLYNSAHDATVTQMSPQQEYALKVTVTEANTIDNLATVAVTVFYDSDGDDSAADIPAADTQVSCVLTCTVGSTPTWSQNPSSSTTWDIVETSCTQPTLTAGSGTFWFHFKPGKVAAEASDWDVHVAAIDEDDLTDAYYDGSDYDMLWYGEIDVSGTAPNWGTIMPGMDFDHVNARESVTASCISNGDYDTAVSTGNWAGSGNTATLNTAGTPGTNEFSMKAWSSDNLTAADLVTTVGADCVIDSGGGLTTESGESNSANTLYLKIGTPFVDGVYSGTITFHIING